MTTTAPILVVGGGICGLATALAIARKGLTVHLLEQADEFTELGAGLQVGPNASRAMDALGILDDILPQAVQPRRGVLMDAVFGETLTVLDLGRGFRQRYGYPYLVLHRSDLLDALVDHCCRYPQITLETKKQVVSAELGQADAIVRCTDGTEYRTHVLIAADGLHSVLRSYVVDDDLRNSGFVAYRGTVPMARVTHMAWPDDVVLWVGPQMHLMQYPLRGGELYNQVAVFRSERFAAGYTEPGTWGGPDEFDAAFTRACAHVQGSVSHIGRDRFWPMFDRDPVDNWVNGRLVLVGDAAHPMLQYLGQGACQSLEDAVELGYRLHQHTSAGGDIDVAEAFGEFQNARQPRATRCQSTARPWGDVLHAGDPLTVELRRRVLHAREADDYSELDWMYCPADEGTAAPELTAQGGIRCAI